MKKSLLPIFLLISSMSVISQTKVRIVIPEAYELANIILALTDYGKTDQWEVLKSTYYYRDVMSFFEPVKNHPLLDSVNFSRERWADYLSFRTDAFAFQLDKNNKVRRQFDFYSDDERNPFDKNMDLINDFIEKSKFRQFYKEHQSYYNFITSNYLKYYFIDSAWKFLNKLSTEQSADSKYFIVLSPLVNRMHCHRDIAKDIVADFSGATSDFLNQKMNDNDLSDRLNGNHMIFTEMDHGFVNPISEKLRPIVFSRFDNNKWDHNSGYEEINVFNEYMTWALWDIFVKENFPEVADSISLQWQYQNASRGFFAAFVFSNKLLEIYRSQKGNLESLYIPILEWCKSVENILAIPVILNYSYRKNSENGTFSINIDFSKRMKQSDSFGIILGEMQYNKENDNSQIVVIDNAVWTNDGKRVEFDLKTEYNEFRMQFNWWGISKPVVSEYGIFIQNRGDLIVKEINQTQAGNSNNIVYYIIAAIVICLLCIGVYRFRKK